MSWVSQALGAIGDYFGGGGKPPIQPGPGGFVPPAAPPQSGSNVGVPPGLGGASGLSAYAQPPLAPPPFMPSSQGMSQYNMAGNLSGPVGSTTQPQGGSQDDGGTPWYKNPAILNTIAGAGSALLQNHNEAQNRAQNQQRIDLEKRQYDDQHQRQQATSDALNPIIARLIGQRMQASQGNRTQG